MDKNIKKIFLISILFTIIFGGLLFVSETVFAGGTTLEYLSKVAPSDLKKGGSISGVIGNVLGLVLSLVGVIFFALMIFGGIKWMTSRGNEQKTGEAFGTIISATIGLIIIMSSYILVTFLFERVGRTEIRKPAEVCVAKKACSGDFDCGGTDKGRCEDLVGSSDLKCFCF